MAEKRKIKRALSEMINMGFVAEDTIFHRPLAMLVRDAEYAEFTSFLFSFERKENKKLQAFRQLYNIFFLYLPGYFFGLVFYDPCVRGEGDEVSCDLRGTWG